MLGTWVVIVIDPLVDVASLLEAEQGFVPLVRGIGQVAHGITRGGEFVLKLGAGGFGVNQALPGGAGLLERAVGVGAAILLIQEHADLRMGPGSFGLAMRSNGVVVDEFFLE